MVIQTSWDSKKEIMAKDWDNLVMHGDREANVVSDTRQSHKNFYNHRWYLALLACELYDTMLYGIIQFEPKMGLAPVSPL